MLFGLGLLVMLCIGLICFLVIGFEVVDISICIYLGVKKFFLFLGFSK